MTNHLIDAGKSQTRDVLATLARQVAARDRHLHLPDFNIAAIHPLTPSLVPEQRVILSEFDLGTQPSDFFVLALCGANKMFHIDDSGIVGSKKSRIHNNVPDVTTRDIQSIREEIEVDVGSTRSFIGEMLMPDAVSLTFVRKRVDRVVVLVAAFVAVSN